MVVIGHISTLSPIRWKMHCVFLCVFLMVQAIHLAFRGISARHHNLPPPPTQGNKIDCARPDCRTISGSRTQGSKTCLENKCKKCCVQAAADAFANGRARKQCQAHPQPETIARADSQPQPTVPLQNIAAPVGFLPQDVPLLTPPPNQPSLVQSHDISEPPAPT